MSRAWPVIAVLAGMLIGTSICAVIGSYSGNAPIGAVIGAAVGAGVALGAWSGWLSVPTTGGIVGAALGAMAGPGCDDYTGMAAVLGFFSGMAATHTVRGAFRWLGVRALFLLPCVIIGIIAFGTGSLFWFLVFVFVGLFTLTWDPDTEHSPRGLRWYQYRLRTMLLVMLLASFGLSALAVWSEKREAARKRNMELVEEIKRDIVEAEAECSKSAEGGLDARGE